MIRDENQQRSRSGAVGTYRPPADGASPPEGMQEADQPVIAESERRVPWSRIPSRSRPMSRLAD